MLAMVRSHLTFANVVSLMALVVALSGGAYALTIPKSSVGAKQLKKNAVTHPKIKKGAVTSAKVKDRSLLARDFGAGQLPAGPQGQQGPQGPQGPPGSDAQFNGAAAGGDLTGSYPNPTIADNAVGSAEIANNAVTGNEISDGAIAGREFFAQEENSLNFPSINGGTCSALTVQRQGTPDAHLLVTPPSHFADTFTLTGKVVPISVGIVQYRFVACNVFGGGGAADPDSSGGTYRHLVIL